MLLANFFFGFFCARSLAVLRNYSLPNFLMQFSEKGVAIAFAAGAFVGLMAGWKFRGWAFQKIRGDK